MKLELALENWSYVVGYNLGRWEERRCILQKGGQNDQRRMSRNVYFIFQESKETANYSEGLNLAEYKGTGLDKYMILGLITIGSREHFRACEQR